MNVMLTWLKRLLWKRDRRVEPYAVTIISANRLRNEHIFINDYIYTEYHVRAKSRRHAVGVVFFFLLLVIMTESRLLVYTDAHVSRQTESCKRLNRALRHAP